LSGGKLQRLIREGGSDQGGRSEKEKEKILNTRGPSVIFPLKELKPVLTNWASSIGGHGGRVLGKASSSKVLAEET